MTAALHPFLVPLPIMAMALIAGLAAGRQPGAITVSNTTRAQRVDSLVEAFPIARQLRHDNPDSAVTILLPPGLIRLAAPLRLTVADSGTAKAPLVLRGSPDGSSVLSGAAILDDSPAGMRRYDLAKVGPAMPFTFTPFSSGGNFPRPMPLLFRGNTRLPIARWPASGYATPWRVTTAPGAAAINFASSALPRLQGQPWIEGYFTQDWLFEAVPVRRTPEPLSPLIISTGEGMPASVRDNARLRLVNDPAFLRADSFVLQPGQTTVDVLSSKSGIGPLETAVADTLLELDGVSHLKIVDLSFVKARMTPVVVRDGTDIAFTDCLIGHAGQYAIDVQASRTVTLSRCMLIDTGSSGAFLEGGDRSRLERADLSITDSLVTDAAVSLRTAPGIALWGVGNSIRSSRIESLPGPAIVLHGNEHVVADNVIGPAVCEMSDAGAIYMGRNWTERGIRLERNFIHDIGDPRIRPLASGVYLDDEFSGAWVADNIFQRMAHGVFIGGGRDNRVNGNVFVQMRDSAIYLDDRGMTWQRSFVDPGGSLRVDLSRMPIQNDLWRQRYPALATLLQNRPGEPIDNSATGNTYIEAQRLWTAPIGLAMPSTSEAAPALAQSDMMGLNQSPEEAYRILSRFATLPATPLAENAGPRWLHPISLPKGCAG